MTCTSAADLAEQKALAAAKMAARDAATAAANAATAAAAAADAQMANKEHDEVSYALAQNAAARAKAASDAAAAAHTAAQAATTSAAAKAQQAIAEGHQQTAEAEQANAMKYAGMVLAKKNAADEAARVAAKNKEVGTKLTAMNTEAGQSEDAGLGGTGATIGTENGNYELAIEYGSTTITVHGATDARDVKFMARKLGGGTTMLTREHEADDDGNVMTEISIVSTDIEAPKPTAFAKVSGQTLNARDLDTAVDADGDGDATNDYTALTVATSEAVRKLIKAGSFAPGSGASTTLTFDHKQEDGDNQTPGNQPVKAYETAGTYNGAMGTYRCNATDADCTVTLNAKGAITAISAGWVFTPAKGATSDVPDAEYLHYGFWLKKTADSDGVVTYNEVETFAGATGLTASGSTDAVEGTASYSGGATGVYVHDVYTTGGGKIASRTAGHFTADVSLKAYFGGNDVAVNKQDRLTGTINNFMLSGGEANDWSVALESDGDSDTTGIQPDTDGVLSGTAKGGVGNGSFSATYYGTVNATTAPGAVAGEFNAGFSNGAVAGAFGATKDKK